ncbi:MULTISPECIES: hypothetical protein [Nitrosopumilus]|uniref:hypothetical protein n=1 Tax=Nitrosopumilus TaxID=338191 RepID=UPI00037716B0|nr:MULTISPECIES: hypothetical protein [Nitrosopumilus]
MNFISKKVLDFQKKKLKSAEYNLKKHIHEIERLEEIKNSDNSKEIENQRKMVKIWTDNIKKIKEEIKKIESR